MLELGNKYKFNLIAFLFCLFALIILFYQSEGVEGGLDSWQHFLKSKYAIKYPDLFLDQWNKPVFTAATFIVCQAGIDALVVFNIFCLVFAGLLLSISIQKLGFKNSWVIIPFMVFTPILFVNSISGNTEALNIFMIALFVFLWINGNLKWAVTLAGFLPFVRTEGFVICGAILLLILYEKQYRIIPFLIVGSVAMNILGFIITGHVFWIITENPYWKHEMNGTFDPGSGSFSHFFELARPMFGLPLLILLAVASVFTIKNLISRTQVLPIFLFSFAGLLLYFMAHVVIYYYGILGSHGLTRPMAVLAPFIALLCFYGLDAIIKSFSHQIRIAIVSTVALIVIYVAYRETGYPKPYKLNSIAIPFDKTQINFEKAGNWLIENNLIDRCIIQQSPYFNARFGKDPFDVNESYWIWSIDQENDWSKPGSIVIWDGFSAKREGNMKLDWLLNNSEFRKLHFIEGFERPAEDPGMYDVYIFEKITKP